MLVPIDPSRDDDHKHPLRQVLGKRLGGQGTFCEIAAMRVLIADDQKSVGTSLAELVRLCHHEVVEVVGSGLEAIQAYGRHKPDVVLMDYQMPKLNGATACRNILAKHPDARVILVSGSPKEIGGSGALALLLKPVKLDQLYAALYDAAHPPPSDV
jgi:CheY-like chemotaxis protein